MYDRIYKRVIFISRDLLGFDEYPLLSSKGFNVFGAGLYRKEVNKMSNFLKSKMW